MKVTIRALLDDVKKAANNSEESTLLYTSSETNLSHHYASATDRLLRFTLAVVMDDELCWFNCVPHFPGLSGYIRARHRELKSSKFYWNS